MALLAKKKAKIYKKVQTKSKLRKNFGGNFLGIMGAWNPFLVSRGDAKTLVFRIIVQVLGGKLDKKNLYLALKRRILGVFDLKIKQKTAFVIVDEKCFTFFFRETLNSDVTVSKKINFFEQTMVWRVTRGEKSKKIVGCRLHIGILCFCGERMLNRTLVYNLDLDWPF